MSFEEMARRFNSTPQVVLAVWHPWQVGAGVAVRGYGCACRALLITGDLSSLGIDIAAILVFDLAIFWLAGKKLPPGNRLMADFSGVRAAKYINNRREAPYRRPCAAASKPKPAMATWRS